MHWHNFFHGGAPIFATIVTLIILIVILKGLSND